MDGLIDSAAAAAAAVHVLVAAAFVPYHKLIVCTPVCPSICPSFSLSPRLSVLAVHCV